MTPDEIIEVMQGFKSGRGWQFLSTASEWKTPILSSLESMLLALYSGQTIRLAPLPDEITIPARVIPAPLREEQAENARLRAQVETCKEQFQFFVDSDPRKWAELSCPRTEFEDWVKRRAAATIAALGETN